MKKLVPLLIAGFVFVTALILMGATRQKTTAVYVASRNLPTGHTLTAPDLTLADLPEAAVPEGAVTEENVSLLLGGILRTDRSAGDVLTAAQLGGQSLTLQPNERAIALSITDSAGLAGLLKPGDFVGITAVLSLSSGGGTYAKVLAEGLRVLYLTPEYAALDPAVYEQYQNPNANMGGSTYQSNQVPNRENTGVVVLAVPTDTEVVAYDFAPFGVDSPTRLIALLDLLPALDHAKEVELSLFIQPDKANAFTTSGIYLPDLVLTPGPSPTPTDVPPGYLTATGTPLKPTSTPASPTSTPTP